VTQFLQLAFDGLSLGCVYALIALGFTVIYRASEVINFAQGAMVLLSAYVISWLTVNEAVPFFVSVGITIGALAAAGAAFHRLLLRRVVTERPIFAVVMITIGLGTAISAGVDAVFGSSTRVLGDPWGSSATHVGAVVLDWVKLWAIITSAGALAAFFLFDRYSRYGLAMRATACDEEAARSIGIPVARVQAIAWAVAGALAVVAAVFLSGYPSSPNPNLGDSALTAFPAVILGGLGSPAGAVIGGILIGLVEVLAASYDPSWLGNNFYEIAPYIVMIVVLLARPYGLFGARPVDRL
jgi:branched-chain amino acid transport system permease protein